MTTVSLEVLEVEAKPSSWNVALAQLPGMPPEQRLEMLDAVAGMVDRMRVLSRRRHVWDSTPRPATFKA